MDCLAFGGAARASSSEKETVGTASSFDLQLSAVNLVRLCSVFDPHAVERAAEIKLEHAREGTT